MTTTSADRKVKRCAGCSAPLLVSDPDVCEKCDMHAEVSR